MKKFLILISLLVSSQQIFAQLEKGMIAVGITSSVKAGKTTNENTFINGAPYYFNSTVKTTTFNVAPTVSYFLSSRFAVGIQLGYNDYVNITESTNNFTTPNQSFYSYSKSTSAGIVVTPYIKYYFPLSDNVSFLLKGSYSLTNSSGKISGYTDQTNFNAFGNGTTIRNGEFGPNKTKTIGMNFGISPGLLFMPSKKIGIEFNLGNLIGINSTENKTTEDGGNSSKYSSTNVEFFNFNTLSVGTGIYYFFK